MADVTLDQMRQNARDLREKLQKRLDKARGDRADHWAKAKALTPTILDLEAQIGTLNQLLTGRKSGEEKGNAPADETAAEAPAPRRRRKQTPPPEAPPADAAPEGEQPGSETPAP